MRRVAAVVGAVLLVVLAVAVRSRLTGDVRGTTAAPARLICVSELATYCRELDAEHDDLTVRIEEAGVTQAALAVEDVDPEALGIDGWLAPTAMVEMVRAQRSSEGLPEVLAPSGATLGRTPTVMAVWSDRLVALEDHCGGTVSWNCVAEVADQPWVEAGGESGWGDVKVGFPSIETSDGVLTVAAATASLVGTEAYASNDFADLAFQEKLGNLARSSARSVPRGTNPVTELLTKGPASLQIAASTEAVAGPAVAASARGDKVRLLYPTPMVTADLVLTPIEGAAGGERLGEILSSDDSAARLAAAGWRVDGQPNATGVATDPPLPATSGAPKGGVLIALRSTWTEVS